MTFRVEMIHCHNAVMWIESVIGEEPSRETLFLEAKCLC